MSDPLLEAQGLRRAFGDRTVVENVSLEVHAGEIVGLLGPNGAGKTTTLRMLAGILGVHEGGVTIAGHSMAAHTLEAKRALGFLSGDTQLYQRLTPVEMLRYFGRLYGMGREHLARRISTLVRDLAMESFQARPCGELSAGQRQRANIARAFLHEPPVLILDEPTTALDVVSGRFIVESLRQARARGQAILFSTHIMGEAEYLCDRIYFMHAGGIVMEGSPAELIERTRTGNLTDAFLKAVGEA